MSNADVPWNGEHAISSDGVRPREIVGLGAAALTAPTALSDFTTITAILCKTGEAILCSFEGSTPVTAGRQSAAYRHRLFRSGKHSVFTKPDDVDQVAAALIRGGKGRLDAAGYQRSNRQSADKEIRRIEPAK